MRLSPVSTLAAAFGLMAGMAALGAPGLALAAKCEVMVVITDEQGNAEAGLNPTWRACQSGERNGDIEYYNPYTNTRRVIHDVPLQPLAGGGGSGGGSSGGGSTAVSGSGSGGASSTPTSGCTPAPAGGTKIKSPTVQRPSQHTCASTAAAKPAQ